MEKARQKIYDFFNNLDRKFFMEGKLKEYAHLDRALPIGFKQTISQPSLVLYMTSELDIKRNHKILEIGTGSGYQTAFLAEFAREVYTVERIEVLSQKARERIAALGYTNVYYKIGDGSKGWLENSPYDRIMVTAGAGEVPECLIDQLKVQGRMIIPVGEKDLQELLLITKDRKRGILSESLGQVRFVELKGGYGWKQE